MCAYFDESNMPGSLGRLGPYDILERIGEGTYGVVFRAFDNTCGREVAIKVLAPHLASNPVVLRRFIREARTTATLRHKWFVEVFAIEELPIPYVAMELVHGESLKDLVADAGPLEVARVVAIVRSIASALADLHEHGVVHRDLSPANVMLSAHDEVKIIDLGLAMYRDDPVETTILTESGEALGTPDYIAPEQWDGAHRADHRSDLYSLGCVMLFLLTGRAPYDDGGDRRHASIMHRHLQSSPPRLDERGVAAPAALQDLCSSLLAKHPDDRPNSAADVIQRLDEIDQSSSTSTLLPRGHGHSSSRPPLPRETGRTSVRARMPNRRRVILALCAAATTVLAGGAAVATVAMMRRRNDVVDIPPPPNIPPPPFAIAPFDSPHAREYQTAWAKYLDVESEVTIQPGITFVLIPPGEFTMGMSQTENDEVVEWFAELPENTKGQLDPKSAVPAHRVRITQPFYMSKFEITQSQYGVVEKTKKPHVSWFSPKGGGSAAIRGAATDEYPVECVSFYDAVTYCNELSKYVGLAPCYELGDDGVTVIGRDGCRLPTEAEWEYACRAGTESAWYHGDQQGELEQYAHYGQPRDKTTIAVGQKRPNPFGLHDMQGNVWEWCQDWYDPTEYARQVTSLVVDPQGPEEGTTRVLRGGDWVGSAIHARAGLRNHGKPSDSSFRGRGFRVVVPISIGKSP